MKLIVQKVKKLLSIFNEYDVIEYTDYDDEDSDLDEEYDDYY